MPTRRSVTALLAAAAVAVAGLTAVTATAAQAATGCKVDYKITNQWQGGFGADVTVTNLGDPVSAWTVGWSFGAGQKITTLWSGTATTTARRCPSRACRGTARWRRTGRRASASTPPGAAPTPSPRRSP